MTSFISCTSRPAALSAWTKSAAVFALTSFAAMASAANINFTVIDKSGEPMQDVVLYAEPVSGQAVAPAKKEIQTISQHDLSFDPYVMPLQVGTQVKFPNNDKFEHHVKSFSPAKEFQFKIYNKGELPPPVTFDKPGVVVIYCLLHGWMRSYVYAVDTPYFTKTDKAGTAKLSGLVDGTYEIKAWHPDFGELRKPLMQQAKLSGDTTVPMTFSFDIKPKKKKEPQQPKPVY